MTGQTVRVDGVARTIETPVLIVGAGPVGLALASDLGSRGIACVVADQAERPIAAARASRLDPRSMEMLRRWGIAQQVRNAAAPEGFPHTQLFCTGLTGYEIARFDRPDHGGHGPTAISPEKSQRCSQLWLDPMLRELAASYRDTRIHNGWLVERLEQRGDCVLAEVTDTARRERRTIAARLVVDCSGAGSRLRAPLAIDVPGDDDEIQQTAIQVRIPALWQHHDKGPVGLIGLLDESGVWADLELLDGHELYRLSLHGKAHLDQATGIDTAAVLHKAIGMEIAHEVGAVEHWTSRNAVAARFGEGRILLAGDAAHQTHSAAGLSLHIGFGDAFDLGWKIEATLAGWALSGLVGSYEPERRPIALRAVAHAEARHGRDSALPCLRDIAERGSSGRAARTTMARAIMARQQLEAETDDLTLGYCYARSPVIVRDDASAPPSRTAAYQPTTTPGARAPHRMLQGGSSTLDLFGRGFVLLRLGQRAPEPQSFERAFAHRGVPLVVKTIENPDIARTYERRLVLVRPDGHVAWRGDEPPDNPLAVADRVRGAA